MSKFYEVSDDTIKIFNDIFKKKSFPVDVKFQFIGHEAQKKLIKISKIPDQFVFLMEKELLVTFNDELMSVFDDESIQILIEQELDKVTINIDSGKISVGKLPLVTSTGVVNKYGIDKVSRANQVEILTVDQKEDAESEFIV
jgi:hypothetical protein